MTLYLQIKSRIQVNLLVTSQVKMAFNQEHRQQRNPINPVKEAESAQIWYYFLVFTEEFAMIN